jgi:hypothetical protein
MTNVSTFRHRSARLASRGAALAFAALALHAPAAWAETTVSGVVEPLPPSTDDTSGVLVPETSPQSSPAGALLVVPRAGVTVVTMPIRGGLTLYERYQLKDRILDFFFNDARTFGIYPAVAFETQLSTHVGLRLVHKDLFGIGARLRLRADYGGETRHRLDGALASPSFAGGWLRAKVAGGWQRQPNAPFYGIGDHDLAHPDATVIDLPARAPLAVSTHFGQQVAHGELAIEVDAPGPLFAAVSGAYFARTFTDTLPAAGPPGVASDPSRTEQRFDTATLVGWQHGTRVGYAELQLGWDSLAAANQFVPEGVPSTGAKLVAFAGLARDVSGAGAVAYTRYGVNALRYFDLYNGDRVLTLHARLEGVAGAESHIPFTDLPRLGGPVLLRGYTRDRFRDRVSMLASIEYRYPVWRQLAAYVFVDAGRVVSDVAEAGRTVLTPRDWRASGGGGLELLTGDRFRLRFQGAGSPEGAFFQFAMEPVYRLPTHNYRI